MRRTAIVIGLIGTMAGCGDPLAGVDRIDEVDLLQTDASVAALPTEAEVVRESFFGTEAATQQTEIAAVAVMPEPEKGRGLRGLLRRATSKTKAVEDTQADAVAQAVAASQAEVLTPSDKGAAPEKIAVETAALAPEPDAAPKRRGLFGRAKAKQEKQRTGPDASDVPYGSVLSFGLVARVCDAKGKDLGARAEKAPARGFSLYDSSPGSAVARTWYITGFSDGCPRQLTAANVLLGSASLYEQLHYGPAGKDLPYAATDAAYDGVKRKVCGTRKGKPCGAKMSKMENSTFFLSAYDSFGNSSRWSELLIHDGAVLASAIKSNG